MIFSSPYWSNKTKIQLLQRWILVHSYLYYILDDTVVDDHIFDNNAMQLTELQMAFPDALTNSRYYYAMEDFDGSSGFGFVQKLEPDDYECIIRDANMLLKNRKLFNY